MRNLRIFSVPQSIIISGETGSGKTETAKYMLKFLLDLKSSQFAQHMLNVNILLEAFGNSCTTKNRNSSRFIKVAQVRNFKKI